MVVGDKLDGVKARLAKAFKGFQGIEKLFLPEELQFDPRLFLLEHGYTLIQTPERRWSW